VDKPEKHSQAMLFRLIQHWQILFQKAVDFILQGVFFVKY
jgi:hypothetical protein